MEIRANPVDFALFGSEIGCFGSTSSRGRVGLWAKLLMLPSGEDSHITHGGLSIILQYQYISYINVVGCI